MGFLVHAEQTMQALQNCWVAGVVRLYEYEVRRGMLHALMRDTEQNVARL